MSKDPSIEVSGLGPSSSREVVMPETVLYLLRCSCGLGR